MQLKDNEPLFIGIYCGVMFIIVLAWCMYTGFFEGGR